MHDEGFAGMQLAWLAVETDPSPIIDPIGGVGTLLDFDEHDARVDGMNPPEGTKNVSPGKTGKR